MATTGSQDHDPIPRLSRVESQVTQSQKLGISNRVMVDQIRGLEQFCNKVAENKLLWTPEILLKLQVPLQYLPKFEKERENYQKLRQA